MILAVLLYAYCVGERSSRRIERRLVEDVAFRVVGANEQPDHATLARFRARHQEPIAGLFAQVLALCVSEGLVETGVVSIDSTKIEANASAWSNRTRQQIAEEILAEAERVDAAEDAELGERRGGELPERWARRRDRRPRLAEALRQLEEQGASDWESYQAERAAKEQAAGRKLRGRKPKPGANRGKGKRRQVNTTDPDSRMLRARNRFLQGYNAQAAMSEDQVIVASELTNAANDSTMFEPLIEATAANLAAAGRAGDVGAYAADAGYWSVTNATLEYQRRVTHQPSAGHPGHHRSQRPAHGGAGRGAGPSRGWRSSPSNRRQPRWACLRPGLGSYETIAAGAAPTRPGRAKKCSSGWLAATAKRSTPNAGSPPSRPSATSKPTYDSAGLLAEANRPCSVNGG